jgi:hypothetical protein
MRNEPAATRRYQYRQLNVRARAAPNRASPLAWRFGFMLLCFLLIGLYNVALVSRTEGLERELRKQQKRFSDGCKALENVRMDLESYRSGAYIMAQVQAMNLGLHHPFPGQVRRVSLDMRANRAEFTEDGLIPGLPGDLAQGNTLAVEPRKMAQ